MPTKKAKKPAPEQQNPASYVVDVPVKISLEHVATTMEGYEEATIMDEYEDVIDIDMTETTPEGERNIATFIYLTKEKGVPSEDALFAIASEAVREEIKQITLPFFTSTTHEFRVHIKRNGDISYRKLV